jgi:hypothetical protein
VTFVTAILLWVASVPYWGVWVLVLFSGHLFIDQFRTFVFVDTSKGKGLWLLLADQLAHLVLIIIIAWVATGWNPNNLYILTTPAATNQQLMMVYLIGLAIMVGVVPVLEVEIAVTVLYYSGTNLNETVRVDLSDRFLGSVERVIGSFLLLWGFGLLVPLAFLPRVSIMIYQGQFKTNRIPVITKIVVSFLSTLLVGFGLSIIAAPKLF